MTKRIGIVEQLRRELGRERRRSLLLEMALDDARKRLEQLEYEDRLRAAAEMSRSRVGYKNGHP